jgi:transcriptional regulator with XRE-family HTH domain
MGTASQNGVRLKTPRQIQNGVQDAGDTKNGVKHDDRSQPQLHRIQQICTQQDISIRSLGKRMNLTASEVRRQQEPSCDLRLSSLYRWQRALNVPAAELLMESGDGLSAPIHLRARLLRMMKTIVTILAEPQPDRTANLIQNLKTDILAVMPEVENVDRWHGSGCGRGEHDLAAAVLRQIDDALLMDP